MNEADLKLGMVRTMKGKLMRLCWAGAAVVFVAAIGVHKYR
jgi:hypothetical protein